MDFKPKKTWIPLGAVAKGFFTLDATFQTYLTREDRTIWGAAFKIGKSRFTFTINKYTGKELQEQKKYRIVFKLGTSILKVVRLQLFEAFEIQEIQKETLTRPETEQNLVRVLDFTETDMEGYSIVQLLDENTGDMIHCRMRAPAPSAPMEGLYHAQLKLKSDTLQLVINEHPITKKKIYNVGKIEETYIVIDDFEQEVEKTATQFINVVELTKLKPIEIE